MAVARAVVTIAKTNGIAEDSIVNVWHFSDDLVASGNISTAIMTDIATHLGAFYTQLDEWFGDSMSEVASAHQVAVARLFPGSPGTGDDHVDSPAVVTAFTTPATSSQAALPSQCAITLSMAGFLSGLAEVSGDTRPRARRRGRVFLGPFSVNGMATTDGEPRPDAVIRAAILAAANTMYDACLADNATPVVYSRTAGAVYQVAEYSVDNRYDTIRSRGPAPTTRTSVTVSP
jgi:hypothetical protein